MEHWAESGDVRDGAVRVQIADARSIFLVENVAVDLVVADL